MSFFFTLFIFVCLRSDEGATTKKILRTSSEIFKIFQTDFLESHEKFSNFVFVLKWFCLLNQRCQTFWDNYSKNGKQMNTSFGCFRKPIWQCWSKNWSKQTFLSLWQLFWNVDFVKSASILFLKLEEKYINILCENRDMKLVKHREFLLFKRNFKVELKNRKITRKKDLVSEKHFWIIFRNSPRSHVVQERNFLDYSRVCQSWQGE